MNRPAISLIAAVARDGGIGKDDRLLVHLPGDLPRFKRITMGHPVVMGRKTWNSLGGRALPGRHNIVLTRDPRWRADGATAAASLDAALALAGDTARVYVIGGAEVFALALPRADELRLTEIDAEFAADTYFPAWDRTAYALAAAEDHATPQGLRYRYADYKLKKEP